MAPKANMIDISADQHPNNAAIDFAKVKAAGITRVTIKATEGNRQYVNPFLVQDAKAAAAAGLRVGYYHFSHPGQSRPKEQAQWFLRTIKGLPRGYAMHDLEVEELSWEATAKWAKSFHAWCRLWGIFHVQSAPLYSNGNFLSNMPGAPWGYHLVYAWPGVDGVENAAATPGRTCWAWQFSWTGEVPGIEGPVDLNYCYER